jgi:hypothetical protein
MSRGDLVGLWIRGPAIAASLETGTAEPCRRFRMLDPGDIDTAGPAQVDARRLWAGGAATAVVAALAVVAGVLVARGVLGIPVLAPRAASDLGNSSTAVYAGLAAGCALLATALLHVLLLGAPRPFLFFAWITALGDVAAAAAPFTPRPRTPSRPDATTRRPQANPPTTHLRAKRRVMSCRLPAGSGYQARVVIYGAAPR